MKKIILSFVFFSISLLTFSQDLISGGSNSWIFHTPDSGSTLLSIAPKINGSWSWENETRFYSNGNVKFNGDIEFNGNISTDIKFTGGNNWIFHHPGNTSGKLHFAPYVNGQWAWDKQVAFTNNGGILADGKVGIGTQNPDKKLTVKGTIHCEEVLVDLSVPADYVFQKYYTGFSSLKENYTMPTLEEVAAFTKENHHLPNVPSAATIQEEGLQLKEMTNILLQKIEELTLYTIEQEKRIKALEGKLATEK